MLHSSDEKKRVNFGEKFKNICSVHFWASKKMAVLGEGFYTGGRGRGPGPGQAPMGPGPLGPWALAHLGPEKRGENVGFRNPDLESGSPDSADRSGLKS